MAAEQIHRAADELRADERAERVTEHEGGIRGRKIRAVQCIAQMSKADRVKAGDAAAP